MAAKKQENLDKNPDFVPSLKRGEDRRSELRENYSDWRIETRHFDFLGASFEPLSPMQTLARAKWMTANHGFRYLVTPNVDHIVRLWKEPKVYGPLYDASWLSVCDSRILEVLAKISNVPLKAVPGSDLTAQLFDNVIAKDEVITVIGADQEIIDGIRRLYGIRQINHHIPPMGMRHKPDAIAECAEFIAKNPARYVFICVGCPLQEMVANACLERGDCVGLGLCVGASLEFLTGRVKRAPKLLQRLRLEWLFRLLSEPKRMWKRYLVEGPKIFWIWTKWSLMGAKPER